MSRLTGVSDHDAGLCAQPSPNWTFSAPAVTGPEREVRDGRVIAIDVSADPARIANQTSAGWVRVTDPRPAAAPSPTRATGPSRPG
jgi:hypothetical protein